MRRSYEAKEKEKKALTLYSMLGTGETINHLFLDFLVALGLW